MARIELQDAKDTVAWAHNDSRVALIAPYLWSYHNGCDGHGCDQGMKEMSAANDLRKFYRAGWVEARSILDRPAKIGARWLSVLPGSLHAKRDLFYRDNVNFHVIGCLKRVLAIS